MRTRKNATAKNMRRESMSVEFSVGAVFLHPTIWDQNLYYIES